MREISREDFADEKSKMIFDHRFKFYQTGNMQHILNMIIEEYFDFGRRITEINEKLYNKLNQFDGKFIIYGAGKHAGLTKDYLKRIGLESKLECCCVSDDRNTVSKSERVFKDIVNEKKKYMMLVPDGVYSTEMIENLKANGWDKENYVCVPRTILVNNMLDLKKDIKTILNNPDNLFAIYDSDWNGVLLKDVFIGAKRYFDLSTVKSCGKTNRDLSCMASLEKNI